MIAQRQQRNHILFALLFWGIGNTSPGETQGQPRQVPTYTIEQFMETVRITSASFSADGETILFTSDESGVPNAYAVSFAGGEPQQFTHSTDAVYTSGYFPSDERFLYTSDRDGDELSHIYVRGPDGSVRDLTPGENVRSHFLGWSDDKRSFFFASNDRDPRRMDVYEMTLDDFHRTLLYHNEREGRIGAISPDRRHLAMAVLNSSRDIDLLLYDRETREYTSLSPDGDAEQRPLEFTRDGRALFYLTDQGSEFKYLARYDLAGKHTPVLQPPWNVLDASLSPTGRYLLVEIDNDARTEVRMLDAETLEPVPLPSLPRGDITSIVFSPDESRLALQVGSGRSPGDLYALELSEGEPRILIRTLSPAIDPDHLVEPEVVRFPSYDGL